MSSDSSHRHLMDLRADALFTHDNHGRMVSINEPNGGPAPQFYLGRSADGIVCRFGRGLSDDLVHQLESITQGESKGDLRPLPEQHERYLDALQGADLQVWSGPAYAFPDEAIAVDAAININTSNAGLLHGGLDDWRDVVDSQCPLVAVIEEGRAVAICASVRITNHIHEAGLETLPDYRRKGLASRAVAGWANLVRESEATPVYSTSWDNDAAQNMAASLGLKMIGVDYHLT